MNIKYVQHHLHRWVKFEVKKNWEQQHSGDITMELIQMFLQILLFGQKRATQRVVLGQVGANRQTLGELPLQLVSLLAHCVTKMRGKIMGVS